MKKKNLPYHPPLSLRAGDEGTEKGLVAPQLLPSERRLEKRAEKWESKEGRREREEGRKNIFSPTALLLLRSLSIFKSRSLFSTPFSLPPLLAEKGHNISSLLLLPPPLQSHQASLSFPFLLLGAWGREKSWAGRGHKDCKAHLTAGNKSPLGGRGGKGGKREDGRAIENLTEKKGKERGKNKVLLIKKGESSAELSESWLLSSNSCLWIPLGLLNGIFNVGKLRWGRCVRIYTSVQDLPHSQKNI